MSCVGFLGRTLPVLLILQVAGPAAAQGPTDRFAPEAPVAAESTGTAEAAAPKLSAAERERREVWNSPEMVAARAWLNRYFRSTQRYDAAHAQAYLEALERLDAAAMRTWLAQLEATRRRAAERRLARQVEQQRAIESGIRFQQAQAAAYQAQQQQFQRQQVQNFQLLAQQEAARARLAEERLNAERFQTQDLLLRNAAAQEARQSSLDRVYRTLEFLDRQELREDVREIRSALGID